MQCHADGSGLLIVDGHLSRAGHLRGRNVGSTVDLESAAWPANVPCTFVFVSIQVSAVTIHNLTSVEHFLLNTSSSADCNCAQTKVLNSRLVSLSQELNLLNEHVRCQMALHLVIPLATSRTSQPCLKQRVDAQVIVFRTSCFLIRRRSCARQLATREAACRKAGIEAKRTTYMPL